MPANALVLITALVMAVVVANVALIVSQADIHPNATQKILARKKCAYGAREIHRDNRSTYLQPPFPHFFSKYYSLSVPHYLF